MQYAVNRSILIVDDDPRIRTSLAEALENRTTNVRTAEHAPSLLTDSPADVVLTDVRMPGIGGLELLNLLKERSPHTAVILMTAYQDLPTVATAMRTWSRGRFCPPPPARVDIAHHARALDPARVTALDVTGGIDGP